MKNSKKIVYSGNYKTQTKIAKIYIDFSRKKKLQQSCEMPAFRVFGVDDALKATDTSAKFPIECGVASDEAEFINFVTISSGEELVQFAQKAQADGAVEVIARKSPLKYRSNAPKGFMILGSDFAAFNQGDDLIAFGSNNENLFTANGLDKNYVYRFGYDGKHVFFDNMLPKSKVEVLTSLPLRKVAKKALGKVQELFAKGMHAGILGGGTANRGYNLSVSTNDETAAYALGGIVGSEIKLILDSAFSGLGYTHPNQSLTGEDTWRSVIVKLAAAHHIGNDTMKKKINALSAVHSAMMGIGRKANPADALDEAQCLMPPNQRSSIQDYAADLYSISNFLSRRDKVNSKFAVTIERGMEFPKIDKFESQSALTLSKSQVRILDEQDTRVKIRFQAWDVKFAEQITVSGEVVTEIDHPFGNAEWGFAIREDDIKSHFSSFSEWKNHFRGLNHSESSQAGTSAMYAPLDLTEEGFMSKETGKLVVPMHIIVEHCKKHFGETKSAINIANEILEKKIK